MNTYTATYVQHQVPTILFDSIQIRIYLTAVSPDGISGISEDPAECV